MNYKDNTPTYNSPQRRVVNFGDYCDNIDKEKEELKDIKRSITKNSIDGQKFPRNSKYKFNKVTRKLDDLTPDMIDDALDNLEED